MNLKKRYDGSNVYRRRLREKSNSLLPTRGLLGYRSEFINDTRGEGNMVRSFARYEDYKGEIPTRNNGVL